MKGSYSRRKKKASAAYSQLRVSAGGSHQEATTDGKPASSSHAPGGKTPANTGWFGSLTDAVARASRTVCHDALRTNLRIQTRQTRADAHDPACLRACGERPSRR